ncbi:MAG TPA: DUF4365 domain-containing protein [Gemmataceae bacterium]|nr:DUF4365 domain-containing protein [Gemmataceae bacterium]
MSKPSPSQILGPRKRRTRQHVIADLSVHYVEGFILEAGHTAHRLGSDYGYDLVMRTFDEEGYAEPGSVYFQLKAMETLEASGTDFVYDIDIRDYNLWSREKMPVIFILFDASRRRAYWLAVQKYFRADVDRHPKKGARSIRIRVPQRQAVNGRAIAKMRALQWPANYQEEGEES